jgi:hypothetical protein
VRNLAGKLTEIAAVRKLVGDDFNPGGPRRRDKTMTVKLSFDDGTLISDNVEVKMRGTANDPQGEFFLPRGVRFVDLGASIKAESKDGRSGILVIMSQQDGSHQGGIYYRFFGALAQ